MANAFIEQERLQIQGNTITVSQAAADGADSDDDDDDAATWDEMLLRTVIVHDVSDDMEDVVCVYLENPKKLGGPIESSSYNPDTKELSICFISQQGMHTDPCFSKHIYTEL